MKRERCPRCRAFKHAGLCWQRGPKPRPVVERILARSEARGDCVVWTGFCVRGGYGQTWRNGRKVYAHRAMWEAFHGPVPEGFEVCHTCDNPPCVEIVHLFLGTQQDNLDDMVAKRRSRRGTRHHNVKLTPEQVEAIRLDSRSSTLVALDYPVSAGQVRKIRRGERWRPWDA